MRSSLNGSVGEVGPSRAKEDLRDTGLEGAGDIGCRFGEEGFLLSDCGCCRIRRRPVSRSGARIGDLVFRHGVSQRKQLSCGHDCPCTYDSSNSNASALSKAGSSLEPRVDGK